MNRIKLQLADDTCVTVEGGDTDQVARFVANAYPTAKVVLIQNVPDRWQASNEEPLLVPVMNFTKAQQPSGACAEGVEPLEMPRMKFDR